jgi:nicotinamide-nucleotide amidase
MDEEAQAAAARLVRRLKDGYTITIAESCTGGLLASTLTDIAGASKWFNQSWVTYSYDAKIRELNVDPKTLEKRGAVSAEVAIQMAQGARARANADIAISITGIAGPSNDGTNKKVGYVYVGIASRSWAISEATQIGGSRQENKEGFVHFALLTAIRHWDQAMELAEQNRQDEIKQREEQARIKALEEIARNQRAAAAAESAEWQSQSWSDKANTNSETNLGTDVEWSDDSPNEST